MKQQFRTLPHSVCGEVVRCLLVARYGFPLRMGSMSEMAMFQQLRFNGEDNRASSKVGASLP